MIDFDTTAFERGLVAGVASYEHESEQKLEKLAEHIAARARALAPVDTGRLKASVKVVAKGRDQGGPFVDVGVEGVDYAVFPEFGTVNASPQPFMRPAFAEAPAEFGK